MKIIQKKKKKKIEMHVHFDPFHATDLFWCPLKTSEKLKVFWCFQGVSKKISGMKWVKRIKKYIPVYSPLFEMI